MSGGKQPELAGTSLRRRPGVHAEEDVAHQDDPRRGPDKIVHRGLFLQHSSLDKCSKMKVKPKEQLDTIMKEESEMRSDHMRCKCCPAMFFHEVKLIKVTAKSGTIHKFSHDVSVVVMTGNFVELTVSPAYTFLNPKIRHRQVAYTPQPPAAADSDSRGVVGEDL